MNPVILPVLGANMTHGTIRAWFKREGDAVQAGEALFEVETDKVNAEVEAEASGIVRRIAVPVGTRVPILAVVALIGAADEPLPDLDGVAETEPEDVAAAPSVGIVPEVPPAGTSTSRQRASPAARRLARERGISLAGVKGSGTRGEVTRADVERLAASPPTRSGRGRLDSAFVARLRNEGADLRRLSSEEKVDLYRRHGAEIGERVRIDPGALVIAEEVYLGTASRIGADSTIECERLHLGRLSVIGKRARVACRTVDIGDALWAKDDVVIGGGGSTEPDAHFRMGDAGFIGEAAYLNPCHPITLGDEVCIGARAMLFTHSHWQSILRGYTSQFAPIDVGDHVFIGNTAFVFPGVRIGSGATVTVNSFVGVNVPENALVGGVPARVIRHITPPARDEQVTLFRNRLSDLVAVLAARGHSVDRADEADSVTLRCGDAVVVFAQQWPSKHPAATRLVVLSFLDGADPGIPDGVTVFDLDRSRVFGSQDSFSDEVREFCRRLGIRFRPFAWRHGIGHFDGDTFVPRRRPEGA